MELVVRWSLVATLLTMALISTSGCAVSGQPEPPGRRAKSPDTRPRAEIEALKKRYNDEHVWFVPAVKSPPAIDGVLEDVWKNSKAHRFTWLNDYTYGSTETDQRRPEMPTEPTDAYMLCDRENFYVAFVCHVNDVSGLRGRRPPRERDRVSFSNDYVEIFVDPTHSRSRGYQFVIECFGTMSDVIYHPRYRTERNRVGEHIPWTSEGVKLATSVGDAAYYIEAKIPFRSVDVDPKDAARIWGVSLNRFSPRTREDTAIRFTGKRASARFYRFGRAVLEVGKPTKE